MTLLLVPFHFPITVFLFFIKQSSFITELSLSSLRTSWQQGVLTRASEGAAWHFLPELNAGNQAHEQEVWEY